MTRDSTSAQQPTRIDARYEVLSELGRGGMAVVYRVRDLVRNEELALKQLVLLKNAGKAREVIALFEREFYTLAQLSHPGVVQVYDFGNADGCPYYTMQLVEGGDLNEGAPWPYAKACDLVAQVCSALSLLHSRRFVHRDISPRNIRCTAQGTAKLIDFGAMVPMGPNVQIVGTPAFIAPEVLHQLSLDARTDLFSLGATLYHALTGRAAFAARSFGELRELWRGEPVAPSQFVADIPAALDALVLSLLRIDPSQRPRSAFEVMQRLCAIAGLEFAEPADISQAYLSTPTLVGRDLEQAEFRALLGRAAKGHGGGLAIEGAAGSGRSRLLDACVLNAKLSAAIVARVSGGGASSMPFSSALKLAEHLRDANPELALETAREAGALDVLFTAAEESSEARRLRTQSELDAQRHVLQKAFTQWFRAFARRYVLVIVADDAERIDEASLALLAGLGNDARATQLVLLVSVLEPVSTGLLPALDVLLTYCKRFSLAPLTRAQTESLFASVFAGAPHVAMLSDRVHAVAGGSPRDCMALAGKLLETGRIRYVDGTWNLPAQLTVADLPADATDALRDRIRSLPQLARRLGELQALSLPGAWTRADFAELAGAGHAARVDEALGALLRQALLVSDGDSYTIANPAVASCLSAGLDADAQAERHLALAEHRARRGGLCLPQVHHLLLAGAEELALDRFAELIVEVGDRREFLESSGMRGQTIADAFERGYALAIKYRRPPRQVFELARHLVALSVVTDDSLYTRYGPLWAEQLTKDSGLADYRELDASLEPAARLQEALARTMARYQATPESSRVYRVDEAIKYLARYATVVIVVSMRSRDWRLAAETPRMLEPFASLSPVLNALWQNAVSAAEMNFQAQLERARARAIACYERLGECQGEELRYVEVIRNAIAVAIGMLQILIGKPGADEWLAIAGRDPLQRVNSAYFRRILCLMQGDAAAAERLRRQAELLAVQASGRQMFTPPLRYELVEHARWGDLTGVKQVLDQSSQIALHAPGWKSQVELARGVYQHLRGDLAAAEQAFERCLELTDPDGSASHPCVATWVVAVAGYIRVLSDRGRLERAYEVGKLGLECCERWEVDVPAADIVRELALVEAKLGMHAAAERRINALIATRADLLETHRAIDYETRARIAIEARDSKTALHYASLTAREHADGSISAVATRQTKLLEQARRAGMEVDIPASAFETSVLGDSLRPERRLALTRVATLLQDAREPRERAHRAIEALCQIARASAGVLYVSAASGLQCTATLNMVASPELEDRIGDYWIQQLQGGDMTALTVESSGTLMCEPVVWRDQAGRPLQFMLLKCILRETLLYVGVAALATLDGAPPTAAAWELANALGSRLLEFGDVTGVFPG
jgi:hypothetical protein